MKNADNTAPLRETNHAIGRVMRMHHKLCERGLSALPIHRAQHMLLMRISKEGVLPSQKELAEHMNVSPAAIAMALKRLEADGYITREADKNDSRINGIAITELGCDVVKKSREIFDSIDTAMYKGVSEREREALLATLAKIEANLKIFLEGK